MTQKKPRADTTDTKEAAAQQASSSHQEVGTTAAAEEPKRFTLAPNVQLLGEMQGTGFEDRQWLIQHGDEFLQVTELLYRILEQANGERTL